jgi:hypothetical protein
MPAFARFRRAVLLVACLCAIGPAAAAQPSAAPTHAQAASTQLVVFNRPGANWERRASAAPVLVAHRDLYRMLADRGDIVFSGRFAGEPLLGMAMFTPGIDGAAVRRRLEADPAVVAGYVALEFRHFQVAFGALARPAGP